MPRKKKQAEPTPFTPDELELKQKYPHNFVGGSLLGPNDEGNPFPGKRSIVFTCPCGQSRRLFTQDLFHVSLCVKCADDRKRGQRSLRKERKIQ